MNVLSLFDGISTGRYCLEQAGIQVDNYFSSEIEPSAIKISEKHYPDIIRLGDVTKIHADDLPPIDLLIGGSPCQGFSKEGRGLNFDDPRSKLFFEYVRILNEIRAINPSVKFLLENVEMRRDWRQIITDNLGVEWRLINSKLLSAHNRPRLYWTNIPYIWPIEDANITLNDILEDSYECYYEPEPYAPGIYFDYRIRPECRALVSIVDGEIRIRQATKKGYIVAHEGDGVNLDFPTSKYRRGRVIKDKCPCLTTTGEPLVFYRGKIRRLTINEKERLQTLPDDYTKAPGVSLSARGASLGNGWTAAIITHIFEGLKT